MQSRIFILVNFLVSFAFFSCGGNTSTNRKQENTDSLKKNERQLPDSLKSITEKRLKNYHKAWKAYEIHFKKAIRDKTKIPLEDSTYQELLKNVELEEANFDSLVPYIQNTSHLKDYQKIRKDFNYTKKIIATEFQ